MKIQTVKNDEYRKTDASRDGGPGVRELVLREDFRLFLLARGQNDRYVLDLDELAELSNVIGCFRDEDGSWVVYQTDERDAAFDKRFFVTAYEAYQDAARRGGFRYERGELANAYDSNSPQKKYAAVKAALDRMRVIARTLSDTDSADAANDAVRTLEAESAKLRQRLQRVRREDIAGAANIINLSYSEHLYVNQLIRKLESRNNILVLSKPHQNLGSGFKVNVVSGPVKDGSNAWRKWYKQKKTTE